VFKNVGIIVNREREDVLNYAASLIDWLEEKNIKVFITDWTGKRINHQGLIINKKQISKRADIIISLGGDGTLFRVARDFSPYQIPLLGINLGGLGFLTEIPVSQFKEGLTKVIAGKYKIEKRLMLQATIYRDEKEAGTSLALNDVVISKVALSRLVNLKTFVSGEFITTYSADGLIISTPTGSTAYSLSTGGPIVHPNLGVIILSPICAHTLAVRPLIISENDTVEVILEHPSSKVMLTVDGQVGFDLKDRDIIRVKEASCQAKLIRLEERAFFEILRTKLGWSGISRKTLK
jgi:NAD+ kinase